MEFSQIFTGIWIANRPSKAFGEKTIIGRVAQLNVRPAQPKGTTIVGIQSSLPEVACKAQFLDLDKQLIVLSFILYFPFFVSSLYCRTLDPLVMRGTNTHL